MGNHFDLIKTSIAMVLISGALVACSGSSNGSSSSSTPITGPTGVVIANSDGTCTEAAIDAHNQVILDIGSFKANKDEEHLKGLSNSCKSLRDMMGTISCKAINMTTHEQMVLVYDNDLKEACDIVIKTAARHQ